MTNIIKFLTAGNVDDGKSTLIGRLLYDTNSLYQDQIEEVQSIGDGEIDYSLFLDGLSSERAQKITIDVAYRYFSHNDKKFIIADAPGHTQYTKNMAVAAANSDIVIILIDATKQVTVQTKTHSHIASLFGIKKVVVAINKMDLVNYDKNIFEHIKNNYLEIAKELQFEQIDFVPISAIKGQNIVVNDQSIAWYKGGSIIEYLEKFHRNSSKQSPSRIQIQNIIKHENARYYQAFVSGVNISLGDEVMAYPSLQKAKIAQIIHSSKNVESAKSQNAVSITLDREIDLERGGLLAPPQGSPYFQDHFNADIIWFSTSDFEKSELLIKINHNYVRCQIDKINDSGVSTISLNQIVNVSIKLANEIAFDDFDVNKNTASFLLINPNNNQTMAFGIINHLKAR